MDLREFWDLFKKQDASRFGTFLKRICTRVPACKFDDRTTQILTDVLTWGSSNPDQILDPFGEGDSPNLVAFSGLFGQFHKLYEDCGDTIGKFVHDQQNQFVSIFKTAYETLSKFTSRSHPTAILSDWQQAPTFECSLEQRSSAASFGLQLADISLWMIKRVIDEGDRPRGDCAILLGCLRERSMLSRFDFHEHVNLVREGSNYVESLPLTHSQLRNGQELLDHLEMRRTDVLGKFAPK